MKYSYKTRGVCAMEIRFDLDGDVVRNVSFYGGCDGNLKAISKLVDGMTVDEIERKLRGNTCGRKPTHLRQKADLLRRPARQSGERGGVKVD